MLDRTTCSIAAVAFAAALGTTAWAQSTALVSMNSAGAGGNFRSYRPEVSSDGRYVVFTTDANNLDPTDTSIDPSVVVRDCLAMQTQVVSKSSLGVNANDDARDAAISRNGQVVVFKSRATNLVAGINGWNVYAHDLQSHQTTCLSVDINGNHDNIDSSQEQPALSEDGRLVAFSGIGNDLVVGDTNGTADIFVHDRATGHIERVSLSTGGAQSNGTSVKPSMSADGRFVAVLSDATNLVASDLNQLRDAFLRDRMSGTTIRVDVGPAGVEANAACGFASISADGRYVAFATAATNLVPADTNGHSDVFVFDRNSGQVQRASLAFNGVEANSDCDMARISGDGRYVAFRSYASNLIASDTNNFGDIFVRDLQAGATVRVDVSTAGVPPNNPYTQEPAIADDARFVVFSSDAGNLVAGDTNGFTDIFLRDTGQCLTLATFYADSDGDSYGDANSPLAACSQPAGYVANALDCLDTNAAVHPGAPEVCDGIDDDCDGQIDEGFLSTYCTAGTTTHGCTPSISGLGMPSSVSGSGFLVRVSGVEGQRMGLIFYGLAPAAVSWAIGSTSLVCIAPPQQRTVTSNSGGTLGSCDGVLQVDFNSWIQSNPLALGHPFLQGQVFYVQGWFRDSGAPKGTNLSDGLRFTLCN